MHSFRVSKWTASYAGTPEHDGWSKTSTLPEGLCVGCGTHSNFRQVYTLPCFLVSPMSSVHVNNLTISPGLEDSVVFLRYVGGRQPGLLAEFKTLLVSLFQDLPILPFGFVVGRLLVPTGMAPSDLLLRLLLLLVMLLDCIFSSLAPKQFESFQPWSCLACSLGRPLALTTDHRGGIVAAPGRSVTESHCSYPNFSSVSWISASYCVWFWLITRFLKWLLFKNNFEHFQSCFLEIWHPVSWGHWVILISIFLKTSSFEHLFMFVSLSYDPLWFVWLSLLPIITKYFLEIKFKQIGNADPKFGLDAFFFSVFS